MVQAASTFLVGDDANWMKAESDKNVLVTGKNLAKHINTTAKQFLPVSPNGVLILIAKLLIWKSAPSEKHWENSNEPTWEPIDNRKRLTFFFLFLFSLQWFLSARHANTVSQFKRMCVCIFLLHFVGSLNWVVVYTWNWMFGSQKKLKRKCCFAYINFALFQIHHSGTTNRKLIREPEPEKERKREWTKERKNGGAAKLLFFYIAFHNNGAEKRYLAQSDQS